MKSGGSKILRFFKFAKFLSFKVPPCCVMLLSIAFSKFKMSVTRDS